MRILLYGRLRHGAPIEAVPSSVKDIDALKDWLASSRPELISESVKIAVNDELIVGNRPIGSGDEVSFLPPVSGG